MILFTLKKKSKGDVFLSKRHFCFTLFLLFSIVLRAQVVTEVVTDFGGYWRSGSSAINPTLPNDSHNLLAFRIGTQFFSTGVNNAVLASNGVSYTNGTFKSLPINSISGTVTQSYIALAGKYDGVQNGYSNPRPDVKMKDVLTDGINGLNIGTGVIDFPSTAKLTFPVESIDLSSIADVKPDILFTQIANISTGFNDRLYFINSSGAIVGNQITLNWATVPVTGNYTLDFYTLKRGVTCDQSVIIGDSVANTTRPLRLTAFKLSNFGITAANAASVASLVIQPGGQSDIGFVAYNSDGFVITPPSITSQPQTNVVCTGASSSATFSVTATGSGNVYQWRRNGVNITGANTPSYTISPVTAASAGTYDVVISNGGGTVTSNPAYLNIEITKQPVSQTIVTGNPVILSVSATNATSYQWKKNGVNIAGATDSVYTIIPLNTTDSGSYTVSAVNTASGGCATILSNAAVITPVVVVYSKSTPDINIPSTWGANTDGSGSTPVDFTRAEHTFVLSNRDSGNTLTNLTIAGTLDVKDGVAIIADNTTLDVGWCIRTGSGSISGSNSSGLTVRGNSDLYFTPLSQLLKEFTITGGTINMLSPVTITGGELPGAINLKGGILAVGSNLITLRSTSVSNTSMVTEVGPGTSITYGPGGGFLIERYIPAKRSFRFISPAVTTTTSIKTNWMEGVTNPDRYTNYNPLPGFGTHITGPKTPADSLDVTQTYNPSLFVFDKDVQTWYPVPNSAGTLTAGNPVRLMVRGSRAVDLNNNEATPSPTIIRTTGSLYTGTYIAGSNLITSTIGGYSFVGNPYASPINWNTLRTSGVAKSYYTWDEKFNIRGAYVSYNGISGTNSNPLSFVDENIQSGQAFLVETTGSNPTIQFTESDKTKVNTSVFRQATNNTKLSVQLMSNANGGVNDVADGLTVVFSNAFSNKIGAEDSYKFTNLDENLAVNRNSTALSIEGRPVITGHDTLPLKVWQFRKKDYWFKVNASNFSSAITAVLKDNYLNLESSIDLGSSTTIPFSITTDSASFAPHRFMIIFQPNKDLPAFATTLKAFKRDKSVQVEWNSVADGNIETYELEKSPKKFDFQKVYAEPAKGGGELTNSYYWYDENPGSRSIFYRLKIINRNGKMSYSDTAEVTLPEEKSRLIIFPNPVKGNHVSLYITDMVKGKYSLSIYNSFGQIVFTKVINLKGGWSKENLSLGQKVSPGKYTIQLTDGRHTLSKALIIQ